jgi:hypothetical protein
VVWKPSEKAPLSELATQALVKRAMRRFGQAPEGLFEVLMGGRDVGKALVDDGRVYLRRRLEVFINPPAYTFSNNEGMPSIMTAGELMREIVIGV